MACFGEGSCAVRDSLGAPVSYPAVRPGGIGGLGGVAPMLYLPPSLLSETGSREANDGITPLFQLQNRRSPTGVCLGMGTGGKTIPGAQNTAAKGLSLEDPQDPRRG